MITAAYVGHALPMAPVTVTLLSLAPWAGIVYAAYRLYPPRRGQSAPARPEPAARPRVVVHPRADINDGEET